jgi:hypothetical protein
MRHLVRTELRYPGLWRGCVGAWNPGLGPTGLTLRDWSGRANHGTLTNSPTWAIETGSYSLQFPSTTDHVNCGSNVLTGGDCTVLAWVGSSSSWSPNNFNAVFFSKGTLNGDSLSTVALYWNQSLGWSFFVLNPSNTFAVVRSAFTPVAGASYCVAGVCRGSQIELWVNGRLLNTAAATGGVKESTHTSYIGYEPVTNAGHNGWIKEVMAHRRALAASELLTLARRPGIVYELAPRRRSALVAGFNRRRRLLVGAGS